MSYLCKQIMKTQDMGKFINPFTDVGFKIIFGQEFSKPQLLDFLNTLLEEERNITDLKFLDKEQPAVYDGDRSPIYDILCETEGGEKIIVEMQNREHPNFKERMLYYASEAITRQGRERLRMDLRHQGGLRGGLHQLRADRI